MYIDNEYDITVRFKGKERAFRIRTVPLDGKNQYLVMKIDNGIEADVWQKYDLYFTMEAKANDVSKTLHLSDDLKTKG